MHCLRRAALRTAIAASRPAAPRASASLVAQSSFRATPVTTKIFGQAARCFSQTARYGNAENETKAEQEQAEEQKQPEQQLEEATQEKPQRKAPLPDENGVFIRNMIFDATEKHLESAFEKYGEVIQVSIARDARGLSKGYGFVYFKDPASVSKAVEEVDGSFWHGRRVHCAPRTPSSSTDKKRAAKSHSDEPTDTLYIGNIPYETTDAELNRLFRDLEGVTDIRVAVDRTTGWPRGFCHAEFSNIETAKKGYSALEGYKLGDRILTIDFSESRKDSNKRQWTDSKN